jgi:hypothetical protein
MDVSSQPTPELTPLQSEFLQELVEDYFTFMQKMEKQIADAYGSQDPFKGGVADLAMSAEEAAAWMGADPTLMEARRLERLRDVLSSQVADLSDAEIASWRGEREEMIRSGGSAFGDPDDITFEVITEMDNGEGFGGL